MNTTHEIPAPVFNPVIAQTAKKKVLLVDDDQAFRKILFRLLSDRGYQVEVAANGGEGIEKVDAETDLMLIDVNMPPWDGWDTFEKVSAKYPSLPVIIITARSNPFFPTMVQGVGALLEKPLDMATLFGTVSLLLEEPAEVRRARMTVHPAVLSYIPSEGHLAQKKYNSK